MTALKIQDPLRVFSNDDVVGYAQNLNFVGSGFVLSATGDTINVSLSTVNSGTIVNVSNVWNEIPSGTIDDVNMVFVLSQTPIDKNLMLFHNGRLLREGITTDYVLSSSTISMMTAPLTQDTLLASYATVRSYSVWNEIPSGTINELNRVFYVEHNPISGTLALFYNGILTSLYRDYSLTSNRIVFGPDFTTHVGDTMSAFYEYV